MNNHIVRAAIVSIMILSTISLYTCDRNYKPIEENKQLGLLSDILCTESIIALNNFGIADTELKAAQDKYEACINNLSDDNSHETVHICNEFKIAQAELTVAEEKFETAYDKAKAARDAINNLLNKDRAMQSKFTSVKITKSND